MAVRVKDEHKGRNEDEEDERSYLLESRTGEDLEGVVAEIVVQHLAQIDELPRTDDMGQQKAVVAETSASTPPAVPGTYSTAPKTNVMLWAIYHALLTWLPGAMVARLASIADGYILVLWAPKGCRFESCGGHLFDSF